MKEILQKIFKSLFGFGIVCFVLLCFLIATRANIFDKLAALGDPYNGGLELGNALYLIVLCWISVICFIISGIILIYAKHKYDVNLLNNFGNILLEKINKLDSIILVFSILFLFVFLIKILPVIFATAGNMYLGRLIFVFLLTTIVSISLFLGKK